LAFQQFSHAGLGERREIVPSPRVQVVNGGLEVCTLL
jgi:hypothetical protein